MDSDSEASPCKYFPFELGECEDLENYESGGFHPVHLGDVYDDRYKVVHKLGESPTYDVRSVIASHPSVAGSRLFAAVDRQFWLGGPNGRHLCLVLPVLGANLSQLSKGIYSRIKPAFARDVSLQAVRALAHLHSNGLCHGDFTANNIALRLIDEFTSYDEDDLVRLFGRSQTAPVRTYSGEPPRPHAPDQIVVPLDFCSSPTNLLSSEICFIDFDQSFTTPGPPPKRCGIPAKYPAPEVAVGQAPSPASDIWALGCTIFRIRSGDDLFFDYDTDCSADALRQIVKTMGELPEEWRDTRFDEEGFSIVEGEGGEPFWSLEKTW